ncbi:MAG: hypothetical protein R6U57_10190 [Anaerolineales bacterium]
MVENKRSQPTLFTVRDTYSETLELVPELWKAAERLTSPDDREREKGISELISQDVCHQSPLIAYLLATRLTDPNLEIRFHVLQILGDILRRRDGGHAAPDSVHRHLQGYVSQMRRRQIFAILQVAEAYSAAEDDIAAILNMCSYAGVALSGILSDRKAPIPIRQKAIYFCGRVGFVDAVPALERLISRLQAQSEKQTHMDFVSPGENMLESSLLIYARAALEKLKKFI